MKTDPVVSVLMPVYNGEEYLEESVESILNQSFTDFELLTIDDGSTDRTRSILEEYAKLDSRVKVYTQDNCGLVTTLNRGLKLARGKYLARMDADDISMPERFERQTSVMNRDENLVLLGSYCNLVNADGELIKIERPPAHDTLIRWHLLFDNPFIHSAVMFRNAVIGRHSLEYRLEAAMAEDFDLWSRLLEYGRGQNLEIPLLTRRFHEKQITSTYEAQRTSADSATRIARLNLKRIGVDLEEDRTDTLRIWSHRFPRILTSEDENLCFILLDILDLFCRQLNLDQDQIELIRGRTALRLLMTKPSTARQFLWSTRVFRRLKAADTFNIVKYICYRQKQMEQFPFGIDALLVC